MKYLHYWEDGFLICDFTGKKSKEGFTDHTREGSINSCIHCNPNKYKPLSVALHELNERRKKEEESA